MIRLLLVDDHRLFRVGLRRMLDELKGIQIIGEAEDGESAVRLARDERPDVVLMDLMMPGIGGLEATRRIDQLELGIRVVVLSASDQAPFPLQALRAGAVGYVTKGASASELGTAIKRAFVGKRYLSADVAQALAVSSFEDDGAAPFDQLSNREMQIMMMVVNQDRGKLGPNGDNEESVLPTKTLGKCVTNVPTRSFTYQQTVGRIVGKSEARRSFTHHAPHRYPGCKPQAEVQDLPQG